MPTLEHNVLVEMFRENPELAPRFLVTLFRIEVPRHASVAVVESSLDQLIPVEFRADLVLELRDAKGMLVLAIVLEAQRDKDPDKKFCWPVSALGTLGRLDQEHAAVYFQIIWSGLREPMRQAMEALVMDRQIVDQVSFPPFIQKLIDSSKTEGIREGEVKGKRDTLLRLLARAGIALTENESARIQACSDIATLDRWVENVLGAKTATEVLS